MTLSRKRDSVSSRPGLDRVLVAVDGSDNSDRAFLVAMKMAERTQAELVILTVIPGITALGAMASRAPLPQKTYDEFFEYADKKAKEIVAGQASIAQSQGLKARDVVVRSTNTIVQTIVEFAAKEKIDVIVVGTRGLGGFKRLLMGSVSSGIVTHAPCSVLVVR